ncbi:MAG: hypothetical protein CO094_13590 [Anaerolineae bacterium CG_4_9_14_3_um_filter_57_17]|nr:cation transporter [bacterium]NCT20136.1 cation transporter [bacterium]OIO85251.1 MAG: hypothetical protein AUK01_06630 [Anaerolineae bacterium CG2_30_57_67]PJB64245.1 MAG: hypothetical protein CO094_13590 [Anaerolineae bacterium CG_4_9_14_3_um_filter_57_17]
MYPVRNSTQRIKWAAAVLVVSLGMLACNALTQFNQPATAASPNDGQVEAPDLGGVKVTYNGDFNGVTLGAIAIEIFSESWQRWFNPQAIKSMEMLVIAVIGLVVNLIVAFVLGGHSHKEEHGVQSLPTLDVQRQESLESEIKAEDLNVRSAFLHVVGDAVSSVGVILAAGVIWWTGWEWVDPLMSVFIGIIIVLSSWRVLKSSLHILVEGVPEHLSIEKIGQSMASVPGVKDVHDLHVWSICSGHIALSAHIITENQPLAEEDGIMTELKKRLAKFGIEHTTIQFECAACGQGSNLSVAGE